MLNLDTNILVFALTGALTAREDALLAAEEWGMSAIVLWELTMLAHRRRIAVDLDDPAVVAALGRLHVWPIHS